ncbi:MAG: glycosyl hydrolase [Steroidobacteraceae bacterium]
MLRVVSLVEHAGSPRGEGRHSVSQVRRFLLSRFLLGLPLALLSMALLPVSGEAAIPMGVYQGNGCDGVKKLTTFTGWFGRQPDFVLDFFAADSWTSMSGDATWTVGCWQKQNMKVVYSIPMLPNDGSTLAQGAAGNFDDKFLALAQLLVSKGYGEATIRLGWEFNGGWYPWAAKKDPTNWVKYWQRIVTTMRSVSGAKFKFDWCSAQGYQQLSPADVYPGDDYVDIIGRDVYNQTWTTGIDTPEKRWNEIVTQTFGMNWLRDFAKAHNKPISIPEWGTGTRPDGHGGGDDAYFITLMAKWIKSNNVVYHNYWDYTASDYDAKLSAGAQPLAAAAFVTAFKLVPRAPANVTVKKSN